MYLTPFLVYGCVINFDLEHKIAQYNDGYEVDRGFVTIMARDPNKKLVVPWVSLSLACKTTHEEISAYMCSTSFLSDKENFTYTLDILAQSYGQLRVSTWNRIPCAPSRVDTLAVALNVEGEHPLMEPRGTIRLGGCGGPMPIVAQLYQTLNLVLHNGPILSRSSPLPGHMKLKWLIIQVKAVEPTPQELLERPRAEDYYGPLPLSTTFDESGLRYSLIYRIKETGLLWGYIDRIRLADWNGQEEFEIENVENAGVPTSWNKYGFDWGSEKAAVIWNVVKAKA